ncbi:MAG: hypothetical protein A2252_06465 [Elusimicrobia bacterium RIFOXYA2_FULL_39_19]|nr:MAG: hypothetical protein A2252_06465 [Elusimicrobia bacterium RIFOXYA2_FULL_39_19]
MPQLNIELAARIIKSFRSTISNYRIYPTGSQIVVNSLTVLLNAINEHLNANDSFTISEAHHKMLIDGQEVKSLTDSFLLTLLGELEIQSMTFQKGITLEHLAYFLELITTKDKIKLKEIVGKITDILKSKNITSIAVDTVKYVAVKDGEEVVSKISGLVDNIQTDPAAFMTSLRDIYDSMDTIQDKNSKKEITDLLAKKISSMDPSSIKDFFDRPLPSKIEQSGLKDSVLSSLPQDKIRDIFDEITSWYDDIQRNSKSEFEAIEKLSGLKSFLNKILTSPQARNIPFRFFEELLRVGVLEELPVWIKKEEPTLILKIDKLLEGDAITLLDPPVRDTLAAMVKQLCQSELSDMAEKLTNKLAENLKQPQLKVRSDTIRTLMEIYDIIVTFHKEKILKNMEITFLSMFEKERNIEIYAALVNLLTKRVIQLLLNNAPQEAIEILQLIKRHLYPQTEGDKERRDVTNEYFVRLTSEISPLLIAEMKSGIEKRQGYAITIITIMEDTMTSTLADIIRESDDYRTRKTAAFALKNIGEKAVISFVNSIALDTNTEVMRRIINIFDEFTGFNITNKIQELLKYPDPHVKKLLLRFLLKSNHPNVKALLINELYNKDIAADIIKIISENRISEAIDELLNISTSTILAVQEELCMAFGLLLDTRAIPVLYKYIKIKKSFFGGSKPNAPETVRMRAVWALGRFLPNKTAEAALAEALKDFNESVRAEAHKALSR